MYNYKLTFLFSSLLFHSPRSKHSLRKMTNQIYVWPKNETWKRIVRRASGAVQVLLKAPAIPPARSWWTVPIWGCWFRVCFVWLLCCKNFLAPPSTTLPWAVLRALCPPSTTIPTRASMPVGSNSWNFSVAEATRLDLTWVTTTSNSKKTWKWGMWKTCRKGKEIYLRYKEEGRKEAEGKGKTLFTSV